MAWAFAHALASLGCASAQTFRLLALGVFDLGSMSGPVLVRWFVNGLFVAAERVHEGYGFSTTTTLSLVR